MEWRDQGVLLSSRPHGESAAIIEVLTAAHGLHSGVVRGGGSRRIAPFLQPGTQLDLEWRARLDEHIGVFRVEPLRNRAAAILSDRRALAGLSSLCALLGFALAERDPHPGLYRASVAVFDLLGQPGWEAAYLRWELLLLEEMAGLLAQHGIEPQQAAELAALSDGSVGRALLLQENGGMELRDDAAAFLRQIGQLDMEQFWTRSKGLGELPREKLSEWLMYINMLLRDMLVLYGGGEKTLLYHPDIAPEVSALLPLYPVQRIFQILELVRDTQRRMEANVNLRLLMERFLLYIMERK